MKESEGKSRSQIRVASENFAGENRNQLLQLMCELGRVDRDILVRKFFQDMKNEEIAMQMGLKESMVDSRIKYAMGLRNNWRI